MYRFLHEFLILVSIDRAYPCLLVRGRRRVLRTTRSTSPRSTILYWGLRVPRQTSLPPPKGITTPKSRRGSFGKLREITIKVGKRPGVLESYFSRKIPVVRRGTMVHRSSWRCSVPTVAGSAPHWAPPPPLKRAQRTSYGTGTRRPRLGAPEGSHILRLWLGEIGARQVAPRWAGVSPLRPYSAAVSGGPTGRLRALSATPEPSGPKPWTTGLAVSGTPEPLSLYARGSATAGATKVKSNSDDQWQIAGVGAKSNKSFSYPDTLSPATGQR